MIRRIGFVLVFALLVCNSADARQFKSLCSFTNGDGSFPSSGAVVAGNTIYGATANSGTNGGWGRLFSVLANGSGLRSIHDFTPVHLGTNADGTGLLGGLLLVGDTLFGTAGMGGANGVGTVFSVRTNGDNFTCLHTFNGSDGMYPAAGLASSGNTFFGSTTHGGANGYGVIYKLNTDGSGFDAIYSFSHEGSAGDGCLPIGALVSGDTLYGTANGGGVNKSGTVFAVDTNGLNFRPLHQFAAFSGPTEATLMNNDGAEPRGSLTLSGNRLFGTTWLAGPNSGGSVFALNNDGSGFTNLHAFAKAEGINPASTLVLAGKTLYGSTENGGANGAGAVFAVNVDGSGFVVLHQFTGNDGSDPTGTLTLVANIVYGSTGAGGPLGWGTVFALTIGVTPTVLNSQLANGRLQLTWADSSFLLQFAPTPAGPWAAVTGAVSGYATSATAAAQFFRLVHAP